MKKEEIIEKIKELIPQAPSYWADSIAGKMNKSTDSVYAYARGDRGIRAGYHKEVLRLLKELVAEENKRTKELLS
jgi:hypothetical protein